MKLRNKKTGGIGICNLRIVHSSDAPLFYRSLAEVNRDWEDYEPVEPLIKDPKIRKAVRAWAEANEFESDYTVKYYSTSFALTSWQADIEFNEYIEDLEEGKEYTIEELCGEEEE